MKKKKLHMFKNDPFDIKYRIFNIRMKLLIKKSIKLRTKQLSHLLELIDIIGHPTDNEELELLKSVTKKYDQSIKDIEQKHVARAREYIIDNNIEKATEAMINHMRNATPEEEECINKYIESISEKTGVNFYDCLDKAEDKE